MVKCLRCGWCCKTIWPGNTNDTKDIPEACPELEVAPNGLSTCKIYSTCRARSPHAKAWGGIASL